MNFEHFLPDYGILPSKYFARSTISNPIELFWSDDVLALLRLCGAKEEMIGERASDYDRFLSHYRGGTVLLCREKLIREEIPVEPHDYPVPWVLTERGLYEDGIPARLG